MRNSLNVKVSLALPELGTAQPQLVEDFYACEPTFFKNKGLFGYVSAVTSFYKKTFHSKLALPALTFMDDGHFLAELHNLSLENI